MTELSAASGLTESQVYKWAWDQKKKLQATANGLSQFLNPEDLKKLQKSGKKVLSEASAEKEDKDSQGGVQLMGQAEVTRDEFGGYCCKRWGAAGELSGSASASKNNTASKEANRKGGESTSKGNDGGAEDNICLLLGLDIEKSALEIVKADFKRKKIPLSKAGKYLTASNPYSAHSSA